MSILSQEIEQILKDKEDELKEVQRLQEIEPDGHEDLEGLYKNETEIRAQIKLLYYLKTSDEKNYKIPRE